MCAYAFLYKHTLRTRLIIVYHRRGDSPRSPDYTKRLLYAASFPPNHLANSARVNIPIPDRRPTHVSPRQICPTKNRKGHKMEPFLLPSHHTCHVGSPLTRRAQNKTHGVKRATQECGLGPRTKFTTS